MSVKMALILKKMIVDDGKVLKGKANPTVPTAVAEN